LSISAVGTPDKGGTAVIDGTTIKYSPATDFVGAETFTYTISDGNGGEDTATATITITVSGAGGDENQFFMPLVFR
ncbi:MAG: cadherin-like domain-containing protein, partial [Caldilineaceae bacterium]|nr:cadherin-like domain-containing protein [Caldilineaceae bacterium]